MSEATQLPDETVRPATSEAELRAGTIDLLGAIAYGALTAFERLGQDGAAGDPAPDVDGAGFGQEAQGDGGHGRTLTDRKRSVGGLSRRPAGARRPQWPIPCPNR